MGSEPFLKHLELGHILPSGGCPIIVWEEWNWQFLSITKIMGINEAEGKMVSEKDRIKHRVYNRFQMASNSYFG